MPDVNRERETASNWLVSLTFWLTLTAASLVYAAVVLSPKLLVLGDLAGRHDENHRRLVRLEHRTRYLERVVVALEGDPAFATELGRVEFSAAGSDEERLPVAPALMLDGFERAERPAPGRAATRWYGPFVRRLTEDRRLRAGLLAGAAIVVVGAFTLLGVDREPRDRSAAPRSLWAALGRRYRNSGDGV